MKRLSSLLMAATLAAPAVLMAQGFPNKPIRIVVPYPAGGTTDLMARALQEPLPAEANSTGLGCCFT